MKNAKFQAMVLSLAAAAFLSLGACTAKVSDLKIPGGELNQAGGVAGPSVEGQWRSDCIVNPLSFDGYRVLQISFTGANFEHNEQDYSDSTCRIQVAGGENLKGTFKFTKNLANDVHQIEYRIPIDANAASLRDLRIRIAGDTLSVSQWLSGFGDDDATTMPSVALKRVSGGGNQSPTVPAPNTPIPKPTSSNLRSGYYLSETSDYCDADISTASANGQIIQVYMQTASPCNATTLQFDCQGTVCTDSGGGSLSLSLRDSDHFKMHSPSTGRDVLYSRQ